MKAITQALPLLLILLHIITISPSSAAAAAASSTSATSFVIHTCKSATYSKLCENTCLPFATKITFDLKRMAHFALNPVLGVAKGVSWAVYQVSKEKKKFKPLEKAAINDCMRLTMDGVVQIRRSLDQLDSMQRSGGSKRLMSLNVETWVSAAMADYQSCMNGLEEVKASAEVTMRFSSRIRYATMLLSNALAIVNKIK